MTILFLTGFTLGDEMPLLNPYELVRHSGVGFLPESGTRFIADQAKLGEWAIVTGWAAYLVVSVVASYLFLNIYRIIR